MKYLILLLMVFIMNSPLLPVTWEIKQDGTGDFTTIGAGITVAQDGYTLLVYPGIYNERINYQGKNITITSLYDGDEYDESYIVNTVIDGNDEGTVVVFNSGETREAVLNGLTIRHGKGEFHLTPQYSWGGGIYIRTSSPTISNCYIEYNRAHTGGGILLYSSGSPLLAANVIRFNHSLQLGAIVSGGSNNTDLVFCSENLNSIYLNYGGMASDLFLGGASQSSVIIDTLTVANPDRYFVRFYNLPDDYSLTVNHGKVVPIAADLYVSPAGCDTNSGLSPAEPLQTIALAMMKIAPDSLEQRTVFIDEGIYSRSLNNQRFPVQIRSFVDIIGSDKATTILDLEDETLGIIGHITPNEQYPGEDQFLFIRNFSIKNLAITNGGNPMGSIDDGGAFFYYAKSFTLENIDIHNCHTGNVPPVDMGRPVVNIYHSYDINLRNLHIYDSSGDMALRISCDFNVPSLVYAENIRIRNNVPGPLNPWYVGGSGGGIVIMTGGSDPHPVMATIVNMEITDCVIGNIDPFWGNPTFTQFTAAGPSGEVRIINSTIGNNYSNEVNVSGLKFAGGVNCELINSIIYGNLPYEVCILNNNPNPANIYISHSLIRGGSEEFLYYQNPNYVLHWDETNIDADPLWIGEIDPSYTGDYPYTISEFSPARNAGTLNIPNFEFPEFDLAGNPRIYGDYIDMGAYEWNPNVGVENEDDLYQVASPHNYNLYNYPNPVINLQGMGRGKGVGTTISFVMPKAGKAVIDIYNIKGQFIKRVIDVHYPAGEYQVLWNGRDEQERVVATGFYVYRLEIDGTTVATGRCTFIK